MSVLRYKTFCIEQAQQNQQEESIWSPADIKWPEEGLFSPSLA